MAIQPILCELARRPALPTAVRTRQRRADRSTSGPANAPQSVQQRSVLTRRHARFRWSSALREDAERVRQPSALDGGATCASNASTMGSDVMPSASAAKFGRMR